jgi:hypothetical protein
MEERRADEPSIHGISTAIALTLGAAVIAIPYVAGRAYTKWSKRFDVLAAPREFVEAAMTGYRDGRDGADQMSRLIVDLIDGIGGHGR